MRRLTGGLIAGVVLSLAAGATPARAADRDCSDFSTQAQAQDFYVANGGPGSDPHNLDGDGDGVACESNPCPCSTATGGGGGSKPKKPRPLKFKARVVQVVDGDTIRVRRFGGGRYTVRILGVDTPEVSFGAECGGAMASRSMRRLAAGRNVFLKTDTSQPKRDRYGRLLAYVRRKNKGDLGRLQLRRGMAKVLVVGSAFKRVRPYRATQRRARAARRGVWGACGGFDRPA